MIPTVHPVVDALLWNCLFGSIRLVTTCTCSPIDNGILQFGLDFVAPFHDTAVISSAAAAVLWPGLFWHFFAIFLLSIPNKSRPFYCSLSQQLLYMHLGFDGIANLKGHIGELGFAAPNDGQNGGLMRQNDGQLLRLQRAQIWPVHILPRLLLFSALLSSLQEVPLLCGYPIPEGLVPPQELALDGGEGSKVLPRAGILDDFLDLEDRLVLRFAFEPDLDVLEG
mmetsp:Transcript_22350/g.64159  ORF Transcript_22350/g.64159 Transcript_22350/m.64159 type:complete len:224 (+) Transcript_22350:712-1383(+)